MKDLGKSCIILFIKSPELGNIKSRLSKDINEDMVLSLYKNFVLDLLETLRKGKHAVKIFFFPPESGEEVSNWLGKDYSFRPQIGNDLGERMKAAFTKTFSEGFLKFYSGSDIPVYHLFSTAPIR
jgi:glycosyltransferase A (GT-A) superfamily protein (DUF2064 family)